MLNIENIHRIEGLTANQRYISHAGETSLTTNATSGDYYEFVINKQADGIDYNNELRVVLYRKPNGLGLYSLFCMGLQIVTEIQLHRREITQPSDLANNIRSVLQNVYAYYNK
jgi:hypothetical protein